MKVLHVIPSVSPRRGGPSAAVFQMAIALRNEGLDCDVVSTNDDGPEVTDVPLHTWMDRDGVRMLFFPRWSPSFRPLREFAYAPGFSKWALETFPEYDVIHVHALFSYLSSRAMMIARRTGVPYVLRPLGLLEEWSLAQSALRKRVFLTLCDGRNIRGTTAIHLTSERERKCSHHLPPGREFVVPLGVVPPECSAVDRAQVRSELGVRESDCMLLFLSRLHPKKRIEDLLEALKAIENDSWTLVLAGAGEAAFEQYIVSAIRRLGLMDRVRLPGFVDGERKTALLAAADAFVLPSHSENFGIAVAEAMAAGLPVVVSVGVALAEEVIAGGGGWVVEDVETGLSSVLSDVVKSPEERRHRGELARRTALAEFGWQRCAMQLKGRYREICESRNSR